MTSKNAEFAAYQRTGATYEVVATGADMYGYVPPQDGTSGDWTVVRDLTPDRNHHIIETAETTPVLLRAYIATNHMTVTAVHQAEHRPATAGWTPSGHETWVEVTVDNNGGAPFTTWVRSDTRGWLTAIPRPALLPNR
jgi:hypothetical protein